MDWTLGFGRRKAEKPVETRASLENPTVPVSASNFMAFFGVSGGNLTSVSTDTALKVPAVAAAVAFLSRSLATLPLHAYRTTSSGPKKITGKLAQVIHDAPNENQDSFKFRQYFWQQVFTGGRGLAWIERTPQGIEAIWPLDPTRTTLKRLNGRVTYVFGGNQTGDVGKEYPAADVIDVPFMLQPDGLRHYGPIMLAEKVIQLSIAMNDYASNFFAGGGVPPLALTGPLPAGADAMKRAQADIKLSVDAAKNANEQVFPIPPGYTLSPVGIDPAKGQMIEARRFQVEEVARTYQIPPVFLQDLTRATFTNAEQQDLHLVKHLIGQWAEALEGELNLKLFGRGASGRYVEHNLDGLLRGDFVSRMTGYGNAIQNGIRTPDEIRGLENLPARGGAADKLYIQGATVELGSQTAEAAPSAATDNNNSDEASAA